MPGVPGMDAQAEAFQAWRLIQQFAGSTPQEVWGGGTLSSQPQHHRPSSIKSFGTASSDPEQRSRLLPPLDTFDRAIIHELTAAGLLPSSRATSVTLLSLPCLVALMKSMGCPPHHLRPVEMMCAQRQQIMFTGQVQHAPPPPPPPPLSTRTAPQHTPAPSNSTPKLAHLQVVALKAKAARSTAVAAKAVARADQLKALEAEARVAAAAEADEPPSPPPQQQQQQQPHQLDEDELLPPLCTPTRSSSPAAPAATPPTTAHHFPPPPPLLTPPARPVSLPAPPSPIHLLNSVEPTTATSFPTKLPSPSIWGRGPWLVQRFGFTHVNAPLQLKLELEDLRLVALDPQPNLSREGVCTTQMLPDSFKRHQKNILRYAGCMVQYLGVDPARVSFWCYTHLSHFFLYLSLLQARQCMSEELKKQVSTACMVLAHLSHKPGADKVLLQRCSEHLKKLSKELQGYHQRQRGVSTNPRQHVPPAAPAILWQEQLMSSAQQAAEAELVKGHGTISNLLVMQQVRDATMLGLAYGHATLVARLPLIRTLKATQFADRPCEEETCVGVGCKGNRLEVVPNPNYTPLPLSSGGGSSSSSSSNDTFHTNIQHSKHLFKLCCSHHKNSSKGVPGFEVEIPSPRLHALLVLYEGSCRLPLLMLQAGVELHEDPGTLFFSLTSGKPLTHEQLSSWFRALQVKHGLPLGGEGSTKPLPPSHLRHIFATDRRQNPDLPGPSQAGAAAGMGNSPKVWDSHYYKNRAANSVQESAHSLQSYRAYYIAQQQQQQQQQEEEERERVREREQAAVQEEEVAEPPTECLEEDQGVMPPPQQSMMQSSAWAAADSSSTCEEDGLSPSTASPVKRARLDHLPGQAMCADVDEERSAQVPDADACCPSHHDGNRPLPAARLLLLGRLMELHGLQAHILRLC